MRGRATISHRMQPGYRHLLPGLVCGALWLGGPVAPVRADQLVLTPVADQSFSDFSTIPTADGAILYAGYGFITDEHWTGLVRFDLTAIPPGSIVYGVELTLHESYIYPIYATDVALHPALTAWTEGLATWYAPWSTPGGDFGAESAAANAVAPGPTVFGSTAALVADVQGWVDAPSSNHGWFVIERTWFAVTAEWHSRSAANPALWPTLVVDYAPPPVNHCVGAFNSAGTSATLGWTGSFAHAQNAFTLTLAGGMPNGTGFFFCGGGEQLTPWGNGYLCVDGQLVRLPPVVPFSPSGAVARTLDLNAGPAQLLVPGSTWSFQCKYRDIPAGGALFNSSDGLRVTFAP